MHVPIEHVERGEDEACAQIEQQQHEDRIQQGEKAPGKGDMIRGAEQKEHQKGQYEVDQRLRVFGQQEQILRNVDLREDVGVAHQGKHPLRAGLGKEAEHDGPAEEIDGVMGNGRTEKVPEHKAHDQQRQQRVQNAPDRADGSALVFSVKVPSDQLFQQEAMFLNGLEHKAVSYQES